MPKFKYAEGKFITIFSLFQYDNLVIRFSHVSFTKEIKLNTVRNMLGTYFNFKTLWSVFQKIFN